MLPVFSAVVSWGATLYESPGILLWCYLGMTLPFRSNSRISVSVPSGGSVVGTYIYLDIPGSSFTYFSNIISTGCFWPWYSSGTGYAIAINPLICPFPVCLISWAVWSVRRFIFTSQSIPRWSHRQVKLLLTIFLNRNNQSLFLILSPNNFLILRC